MYTLKISVEFDHIIKMDLGLHDDQVAREGLASVKSHLDNPLGFIIDSEKTLEDGSIELILNKNGKSYKGKIVFKIIKLEDKDIFKSELMIYS